MRDHLARVERVLLSKMRKLYDFQEPSMATLMTPPASCVLVPLVIFFPPGNAATQGSDQWRINSVCASEHCLRIKSGKGSVVFRWLRGAPPLNSPRGPKPWFLYYENLVNLADKGAQCFSRVAKRSRSTRYSSHCDATGRLFSTFSPQKVPLPIILIFALFSV